VSGRFWLLALSLATGVAWAQEKQAPPLRQSFAGRWLNAAGPVITALEVELDGVKAVVHAWAKCDGGECDWGTTDADVYRVSIATRGSAALSAVFKREGVEHRLILHAGGTDRLALEVLSRDDDPLRNATAFAVLVRERPSQSNAAADPAARPVRVGGNIKEPIKLKDVRPIYPDAAKADRIQGLIVLECTIGPDGSVVDARPLRGDHQILIDAAIETVKQWRYTPTVVNGVAVPVIMTVTVNYKLN
jgi:TonB family protein